MLQTNLNEGDDFVKDMMKLLNPNDPYEQYELNAILKNKISFFQYHKPKY